MSDIVTGPARRVAIVTGGLHASRHRAVLEAAGVYVADRVKVDLDALVERAR